MQYFIKRGEKVQGPFSREQLLCFAKAKKITGSDLLGSSDKGPFQKLQTVWESIKNPPPAADTVDTPQASSNLVSCPVCQAIVPGEEAKCQECVSSTNPYSIADDSEGFPVNQLDAQPVNGIHENIGQPSAVAPVPNQANANRKATKGMALSDADLLPGEEHIMTKFANMVISVKEAGLSRFAFDKYMWLVGMKGKEAIGGKAHLTNYRVIFKSHFFNRVRGKHSIFLPNIIDARTTLNKLVIETSIQQFSFAMWFKKSFLNSLEQQKARFDVNEKRRLNELVLSNPGAVGEGLQKWTSLEMINKLCLGGQLLGDVLEQLNGPAKNSFLEILDLSRPDR